MLEFGWPVLFCEQFLFSIPANKVVPCFNATSGRPTQEHYSLPGAFLLQQTVDIAGEETVRQYVFNSQWYHFLLSAKRTDHEFI